jgi:hypothetical protein
MSVLLVAGIGVLVAGLVTVAFGIPVKEFSFGDTLIVSGAVVSCTGLIMISLSLVVRELRVIAQRLRSESVVPDFNNDLRSPIPEPSRDIAERHPPLTNPDQTAGGSGVDSAVTTSGRSPPPWQKEMFTHERAAHAASVAMSESSSSSDTSAPPKPRRNLLFSSSLRKDRERAAAGSSDPAVAGIFPPATTAQDPEMSPPASFDDAWPRSGRSRPESGRASSLASSGRARTNRPSDPQDQNASAVTVLKSGVVDGMAYSLYSDGSIEAQLPEGMMRFGSIDQLRAHLDQQS